MSALFAMNFLPSGLAALYAVGVAWSLLLPLESLLIPTYDVWKGYGIGRGDQACQQKEVECALWVF